MTNDRVSTHMYILVELLAEGEENGNQTPNSLLEAEHGSITATSGTADYQGNHDATQI